MKQTVLVTGAASGIGAEIAKQFCLAGCNVVLNYHKNNGLGLELTHEFKGQVLIFRADVTNHLEVEQMISCANVQFGGIDIVVNNAGVMLWQLFDKTTQDDFNHVFDVNVKGIFNVCKATVPHMITQKFGRIINISSMWGQVGSSCEVIYSAAKAAVDGFTKALAKELGPSNITVNSVAPGVIQTNMNKNLSAQTIKSLCQETPLGRLGTPLDIANTVLFLASLKASFITGQIIGVNGGFVI
ncbi:MAG: elongation factor P 5-aminopentanone reductase [Oscillospiraceae bacterium]